MATKSYIALLRGINVGGKNRMPMADLRECLEKAGLSHVRTYIASGNVLFKSSMPTTQVKALVDEALLKQFAYSGPTVVLSAGEFDTIMKEAPTGFGDEPQKFHSDVIFLKHPAKPSTVVQDVKGLKLKADVDTAHAGTKALYFTRLSARRASSRMGKIVQLPSYKQMTIRSWNTTKKLSELLHAE